MKQAVILCPLYKDETSFAMFADAVEKEAANIPGYNLSFLVVNDGMEAVQLRSSLPMQIIHLHRNIGHQKAIAIGLAYAHHNLQFDKVVIMDCDGEDNPVYIKPLLESEASITVARRTSRQEGRRFRIFYYLYKLLFFVLVGKRISFGNFMALSKPDAARLVHYSELWNHLAGALIKSRLPFSSIDSHRGRRYHGESKMNFTSLLLHGLGAIGVFIEVVASRLMILSMLLIGLAAVVIMVILYIKYFTYRAIPGWATTTVSAMLIMMLQSFLLSLFTIFIYLSFQAQQKFIPAYHYKDYIRSVESTNHE